MPTHFQSNLNLLAVVGVLFKYVVSQHANWFELVDPITQNCTNRTLMSDERGECSHEYTTLSFALVIDRF